MFLFLPQRPVDWVDPAINLWPVKVARTTLVDCSETSLIQTPKEPKYSSNWAWFELTRFTEFRNRQKRARKLVWHRRRGVTPSVRHKQTKKNTKVSNTAILYYATYEHVYAEGKATWHQETGTCIQESITLQCSSCCALWRMLQSFKNLKKSNCCGECLM